MFWMKSVVRSPAPIEWHKPRAGSKLYAWKRGALYAKNMSSNYPKGTVQNGSIVSQNAADHGVRCIIFKILIMLRNDQCEEEATFFLFFLMARLKLISDKLLWVAQVREKSTGLDCWRGHCFGLVVHCKKS
jgi:hypothetical protein